MKVALLTTLPDLVENSRIGEEVKALGYEFEMVDMSNFSFGIKDGEVSFFNLSNLACDFVIVRGIFNSIKSVAQVVRRLKEEGIKVFDNNFLEHRYSIDKVADLLKFGYAKIPVPRTFYSRNFDDYLKAAQEIGYPVVVKSARMGKGSCVFKLEGEEKLRSLISSLLKESKEAKNYLMQEFIDYKYDLRCLIIGNNIFTMRRIPKEGEFRANFSLGGSVEIFDLDLEGRELAKKALGCIDMSVGGVDILVTEDNRRFILEVNHTPGFVGMEKASGVNIGKIYVEHALRSAGLKI